MQELYNTQRLREYALWYYNRYFPSNAKLIQKLQEKGGKDNTNRVFRDIKYLLQEEEIIKAKIDTYVFRNKNYRYIRQKMAEKLFPKLKVEAYLSKYIQKQESILDENFLRKRIESYITKGKSKQYIFSKLWETKEDRILLESILVDYFSEGESENILREYEKLKNKYSKEKITQKLISKWFLYNEIRKTLDF